MGTTSRSFDLPPAAFLAELRERGLRLWVDQTGLAVGPRILLTADLRERLRRQRDALLAELGQVPDEWSPPGASGKRQGEKACTSELARGPDTEPDQIGNRRTRANSIERRPPPDAPATCPSTPVSTSVYRYRLTDQPDTWLILIAPGDDLTAARRVLENQFGVERVIEVVENR